MTTRFRKMKLLSLLKALTKFIALVIYFVVKVEIQDNYLIEFHESRVVTKASPSLQKSSHARELVNDDGNLSRKVTGSM